MISPSIYNPVIDDVKSDLSASDAQIGLSLSLFILFQGGVPVIWASISEIIGRKPVYIASFILYTAATAIGSRSPTMPVLIGMRVVVACGSSAVLSAGAGSLADMYEVKERGRKMGLFYAMPMLGPSLGSLIGGALGNAFGWRSTQYFLAVWGFCMVLAFLFFPDTWRKERSRIYQQAIADALKRELKAQAAAEKKRQRKLARGLASDAPTPATTAPHSRATSGAATPAFTDATDVEAQEQEQEQDGKAEQGPGWWRRHTPQWAHRKDREGAEYRPTLRDVNPLPVMISIWRVPSNTVVLVCSGFLFAAQYTIVYTCSVTLAAAPYSYNPLVIGLVILAFGLGNMVGSLVGGRISDRVLKRLTARNGGRSTPEMRLKAAFSGMPLMVASFLVYAWTMDFKTHIAGPVVALFFGGFSILFVYSNTLAYLVDANPGKSSSAVGNNSMVRGVCACVMSQIALPILHAIGDGGLYTLFSGLLTLSCCGLVLVSFKGAGWRERHLAKREAESQSTTAPPEEDEEGPLSPPPTPPGERRAANETLERVDEKAELPHAPPAMRAPGPATRGTPVPPVRPSSPA